MDAAVPFLAQIRNIGIIAHIDAGKTSVSERFLYYSGRTHRIGDIDTGNTILDYLDEERRRGITITAAAASLEWPPSDHQYLIHLIDTPGHIDFTAEVERSLRVCDGAIVVFSGVEGVEAQSEKVWRQSARYRLPKLAFINKLDRLGASFDAVLREMRRKFADLPPVALQLPLGQENHLSGLIDLIEMRTITFVGEQGETVKYGPIPEAEMPRAAAAREAMITTIADFSNAVADCYLSDRPVAAAILRQEVRTLTIAGKICPVFGGSAKKNIGIQPLLDGVIAYLPSPLDRPPVTALRPETEAPVTVAVSDPNFYGLVFKISAGDSADLLFVRTYSGHLHGNDTIYNPRTRERIRIKRILRLFAGNVTTLEEVGPGDIIGLIGPHQAMTGDTLCAVNRPLLLEKIFFPEPVISLALEPRSGKDKDKLAATLELLCREDPTLELNRNENGQLLLSGMGELHLEICVNRLRREFKLDLRCGKPRVAFRETMSQPIAVGGKFDRMLGEKELFAAVELQFTPAPEEFGNRVECRVNASNTLPRHWITAAETTLANALRTGGSHGYPLIKLQVAITALHGLPEKTTEGAVSGAVLDAVNQAIRPGTLPLEPLMRLNIIAPEAHLGEITGYLQARRAVIHRIDALYGNEQLLCEVPLAEMFGFSKALPQLSGGRAGFSMEPCGYQPIAESDLQRLIAGSAAL
ncbi:MAG: elongation factor G [Victivallales bacterium]|nr:elongation factor G [Victivallales bacterium]